MRDLDIVKESPHRIVINNIVYEMFKREGFLCESCDLRRHCRGNRVIFDMCMELGFVPFKITGVIDDSNVIPESYLKASREFHAVAEKRLKQIEVEMQQDERRLILYRRIIDIVSVFSIITLIIGWVIYAFQHK